MTPVQWLFHYLEVNKFNDEKAKDEAEVLKTLIKLYNSNNNYLAEVMIEAAKISGSISNPEAGKALLEAEKMKEARADIGDDEFSEWWEDFSSRIPSKLVVEDMGDHVDLEGDAINLEKLYEIEMEERRKKFKDKKDE